MLELVCFVFECCFCGCWVLGVWGFYWVLHFLVLDFSGVRFFGVLGVFGIVFELLSFRCIGNFEVLGF